MCRPDRELYKDPVEGSELAISILTVNDVIPLTLILAFPDLVVPIQIQWHTHLRIYQHREWRCRCQVVQIRRLAEPVDVCRHIEEFRRERGWRDWI